MPVAQVRGAVCVRGDHGVDAAALALQRRRQPEHAHHVGDVPRGRGHRVLVPGARRAGDHHLRAGHRRLVARGRRRDPVPGAAAEP